VMRRVSFEHLCRNTLGRTSLESRAEVSQIGASLVNQRKIPAALATGYEARFEAASLY